MILDHITKDALTLCQPRTCTPYKPANWYSPARSLAESTSPPTEEPQGRIKCGTVPETAGSTSIDSVASPSGSLKRA
jgi:hypothetical protein